ncbi:helix-turn-helix domain-containing protein [Pedobacter sp. L105]|uniref:helix-turn-helix domain-containing protein n=1 Tax=Pedobacter sp. L105 TaxID=1641871 RepID=UPI00131E9E87|nr:helix-turn-helix transcriptional regulator [Pedobacter sp. L105]
MKSLGQKFKTLRLKSGYTQKDIADMLEISVPAYSKIETGLTDPSYSRVMEIAKIHKMDLKQLINVGEEKDAADMQIESLNEKIAALELNVIRLQGKLIELYEREDLAVKRFKTE